MELKKYIKSYSFIKKENLSYRAICVVLLITNLILALTLFFRKEAVVLVPPGLKNEVKVSINKADQKYKETWALFFSLLLGNVTPKNIGFVVEEFQKYLAPDLYQDLSKDIFDQSNSVKEGNASSSFEPREIAYDEKNEHVKIKGQIVMHGAFGKSVCIPKTFEFGIKISNYYPQIYFMDAYDVRPKEEQSDAKQKIKDQTNK